MARVSISAPIDPTMSGWWWLWLCAIAVLAVAVVALAFSGRPPSRPQISRSNSSNSSSSSSTSSESGTTGGIDDEGTVKAVYIGYEGVSDVGQAVLSAVEAGFNIVILAFWLGDSTNVTDPYSAAWYWAQLSGPQQQSIMASVHAQDAVVLVSAGGSSYGNSPTNGYPANGGTAFGSGAANWAAANNLDGVDFDLENFTGGFGTLSGLTKTDTIAWITDAVAAARLVFPQTGGTGIKYVTSAPQSPYFNSEFDYGYRDLYNQATPPAIDYFFVQYYNQNGYTGYSQYFVDAGDYHPNTAVAQLAAPANGHGGVPLDKIVFGCLTQTGDGNAATWLSPNTVHSYVKTAAADPNAQFWKTGVFFWQWHPVGSGSPSSSQFLQTVYPQ